MMARCCGGSQTAIQVSGAHLTISGAGSAQSPYVIGESLSVVAADNTVFDTTVSGAGTVGSPWTVSVAFAATAKLDDLPDVNAPTPTNTQVLSWDTATSKWIPRAPTTAASGSISHDTAFVGDGSGGSPLGINEDAAGFLVTAAGGLGLSDNGKNRIVLHYANAATRTASPLVTPILNSLSVLDSAPGAIDYWNGSAWVPQGQYKIDFGAGQLLALSGSYTGGRLTQMIRQISATTDVGGVLTVLSATDLTGYAGVLSAVFQQTGVGLYTTAVQTTSTEVKAHAIQLTTGADYQFQSVTGVVTAWLYN